MTGHQTVPLRPCDGGGSSHGSKIREVGYLGAILIVYIALLELSGHLSANAEAGALVRLLLPNLWLLAAALAWLRRRPLTSIRLRGPRTWAISLICGAIAALMLLVPIVWPGSKGVTAQPGIARPMLLILLVPVAEELYFRGLLLDHLLRNVGRAPAVLLVSGLFGFLHFPQGFAMSMTILSIGLCMVAIETRSVLWPVALHMAWNALGTLFRMPDGSARWTVAVVAAAALGALIAIGMSAEDAPSETDTA